MVPTDIARCEYQLVFKQICTWHLQLVRQTSNVALSITSTRLLMLRSATGFTTGNTRSTPTITKHVRSVVTEVKDWLPASVKVPSEYCTKHNDNIYLNYKVRLERSVLNIIYLTYFVTSMMYFFYFDLLVNIVKTYFNLNSNYNNFYLDLSVHLPWAVRYRKQYHALCIIFAINWFRKSKIPKETLRRKYN